MDVQLLIYDLSQGLARQMSMGFLGFQLDAIYHTSILLQGREYVYDGGIIAIQPGTSHLGQPQERIHLGTTQLPMDVIEEFLDSMRPIFTFEAYDLFQHNCNNFTDSFSNFLLGKGIPEHIINMPKKVLESPMGRMIMPQLTQSARAGNANGSILGLEQSSRPASTHTQPTASNPSGVKNVTQSEEFSRLLKGADTSCAVVFFTSATCGPCKVLYPVFDQLAEEHGDKATFIKVDIAQPQASPIASKFSVRATPTIVTFLRGEEENRWSGADPSKLRGSVQLLVHMAFPPHPHDSLRLSTFSNTDAKLVLYNKTPPLAKLTAKMGDGVASKPEVQRLVKFLEDRDRDGPQSAMLPDMSSLSKLVQDSVANVPLETLFTIIDLFRCALVDPRVSGYFAEEGSHKTILSVLNFVTSHDQCPYALRLVTIQMACNLFSTPLFPHEVLKDSNLRSSIILLISSSFLDESHNNVRVSASSLLFNLALAARRSRSERSDMALSEDEQVELAASLVEAIGQEEQSEEALHGMLLALGHLVYGADLSSQLVDLMRALDAKGTILSKKSKFTGEKLISEVGLELLGKGLNRPLGDLF